MGLSWQDLAFAPIGGIGMLGSYLDDKSNGSGAFAKGLPSASGVVNGLEGNPAGLSSGLQQLMKTAFGQGQQINATLQGEKANSEAYYRPMQAMFGKMYGTDGLMPAKAPGAPGGGKY